MYTRQGDKGQTSLFGPRRVPKDSPRVEAYGSIDELSCVLGVASSLSRDRRVTASLSEIQRMLFVAGADAATEYGQGDATGPRIAASDTRRLEEMTDALLDVLPTLKNFILPGGSQAGAYLQLGRSVCRRAERRILTASRSERMNPELVPFFNRLSSYLFNLSRWVNSKAGAKEQVWKGPSRG